MKKKILSVLITILAICSCVFTLTACGGKVNNYNLSFKVDGEVYQTITTTGNESIAMPDNPTKTGYEFDGWYLDKDIWSESFTGDSLLDNPISSDMSVHAKFTVIEYSISYTNTKDVDNNNPTVYNIDTNTIILMDLQKDGYEFLGWYIGNEKIDKIEKGSTGNITLTADWATTSYTATFYANNVKVGETKFTIESMTLSNIPAVPDKNGYEGNWDNYILSANDIEINAIYTPINYSITYSDELNATNNNKTNYNVETSTFDLTALVKAGYIFDGWFDESNNKVEKIEKGTIGNKTFAAKWSIAEYTITYLNTKGAVNNNPGGYTMESDTIKLENISLDGYLFNGWYISENSKKTTIAKGSYGDIVLTAKWTPVNYSIYYNDTKGASNTNKKSYNIETESFDLIPLTKVGYNFDGWYENGIKVETIEKGSIGERIFTAQWSLADYTITYVNTKNAENNNLVTYTIESDEIVLLDLTAEGYIFEGWYLDINDNKVVSLLKGRNGNLTLIAKWSTEEYEIQYENIKNATNNNKTTYNIETETFNLVDIEKEGYIFEGWYDEKDANITKIEKGSVGDMKLSAKWTPIQYTATFFADGVKIGTAPFTIDDEEIANLPAIPNKDYYTANWESYNIVADSIIINAVYSPINYSISYTNTKDASNPNVTSYNYESSEIVLRDIFAEGYIFEGWYIGDEKVESIPAKSNGIKVFVAKWSLETYNLIYENTKEATNTNQLTYTIESEDIELSDLSVEGYTFVGWFLDGKKVTKITQGNFGDKILTAEWSANSYKVTLTSNVSGASYSGAGTYKYESEVTVVAQARVGYIWSGWYNGETILTGNMSYTFDMPATNVSYKATYSLCENHTTDKYCVCTKCGKTSHQVITGCTCSKCGEEHALMTENGYCRHESYIYFGYYPQTIKSTSVSIKSNSVDENGYYTGSDNKKYAKVIADPYADTYTFSSGSTITSGTAYYFKVEPIKWRILTEEDGKAFLYCESIIDNRSYHDSTATRTISGTMIYANNWQYSAIRSWLNNEFYENAFDKTAQTLIMSTYLDNQTGKIDYCCSKNQNTLCQNNTTDKVFIASYNDLKNNKLGFMGSHQKDPLRVKSVSDYTMARGSQLKDGKQAYWWTRTADCCSQQRIEVVYSTGEIKYKVNVTAEEVGVAPALWIKL